MKDPLIWFKRFGWPVYFWVRQIAHFSGGIIVGLSANFLSRWLGIWPWVVIGGALVSLILYKEYEERKEGQDFVKTGIDVFAWFIGFWLMFTMFGV